MPKLLITGGKQRRSLRTPDEWHLFDEAQIVELDTASGEVTPRLRYRTPPDARPKETPSHVFKSGSLEGDMLVVVTQTEVLEVALPRFEIARRHSLPSFNDLHHAAPLRGGLHVVSTGLDALVCLDPDGAPAAFRSAVEGEVWERFDRLMDYRLVPTTKPHAAHPNFVFETRHGIWLTRFEQRDAICLDEPERRIDVGVGSPHDGLAEDGGVWFTTVNGYVVHADAETGATIERYDLVEIDGGERALGWCRGLARVGNVTYVGFSRLRQTQIRRNISWVKHRFRRVGEHALEPTRVMAFDLERRVVLDEWSLDPAGQDAIFSILPMEGRS